MNRFLPAALILAAFTAPVNAIHAAPWDQLTQRSVSRSHQFIIYAPDPNARATIAMAVEDAKDKFLKLIDAKDEWKHPIVIMLKPLDPADPSHPPSDVHIVNTEEGFKVELDIVLDSNPRDAHFPQQLIRSLLLEFAYRKQGNLPTGNSPYALPPPWLVEGIASMVADPDPAADPNLFRSLIASGKTPALATFLTEGQTDMDTPSRQLYSACAMSLVRLLTDMPGGKVAMQNFIRHWPGGSADPEAELLKAFPALNSDRQSLEKWWTLGLASESAADRYQGLTLAETALELDHALTFDVAMDKDGKAMKSFTLDQYASFAKAPGCAAALNGLSVRLTGLGAQGNPLMREVIGAYAEVVELLAHHDARHLKERLKDITDYRKKLGDHMDRIADYLNWYEATQRTQASGSFDEYVRTANQLENQAPPRRTDPISKYLDEMEQELAQ